jgi:hypothetical protein
MTLGHPWGHPWGTPWGWGHGHRYLEVPVGISQTILLIHGGKWTHVKKKKLQEIVIPLADFVHRLGSLITCQI